MSANKVTSVRRTPRQTGDAGSMRWLSTLTKRLVSRSATCWTADSTGLTLTEILPSSLGRCAARNQSPGSGLVTLNAPVVRFGRVHVRVTAKDPGTIVSRGKLVSRGLMTGGAPDLKYLLINKAPPQKNSIPVQASNIYTNSESVPLRGRSWAPCGQVERLKDQIRACVQSRPYITNMLQPCMGHLRPFFLITNMIKTDRAKMKC